MLALGNIYAVGDTISAGHFVKFKVNSSAVDTVLSDNAAVLSRIVGMIDSINADPDSHLTQILFIGSSSPDGPLSFNKRLSDRRMNSVFSSIRGKVRIPDSVVGSKHRITDWEMLRLMVATSDMPYRDEVIAIIDDIPESVTDDNGGVSASRRNKLMKLHGGKPWAYMLRRFFPALRSTGVFIISSAPVKADTAVAVVPDDVAAEEIADTVITPVDVRTVTVDSTVRQEPIVEPKERKSFYMSLSTNMLYDALLVPNIGAEFYLGRNWSVAADWMYGWWDTNRRHRYWRIYGGEIAVRRWLGSAAERKPLTGHHVGLYAQAITYDFEFGGKGQMAGEPGGSLWDKCSYGVGIEYGYSLPVASRLNIDFTIGVGYLGGTYYEYRPIDGHYVWQSTHQRHWFGPTRAMVSLVWLLGHGNRNEKGGAR